MVSGIHLERIKAAGSAATLVDPELIERMCVSAEEERQFRAHERELSRNTGNRTAKCEVCGVFKTRPSATCPGANCGNHPLQHNATAEEIKFYDQDNGWYEGGL
jgi:hypothetical protein